MKLILFKTTAVNLFYQIGELPNDPTSASLVGSSFQLTEGENTETISVEEMDTRDSLNLDVTKTDWGGLYDFLFEAGGAQRVIVQIDELSTVVKFTF